MANVLKRVFSNKSLLKLRELNKLTQPRACLSVFHYNFPDNGLTSARKRLEPQVLFQHAAIRFYSDKEPQEPSKTPEKPVKLTLFQRFKQMYKEYWYVLLPVHMVTSVAWFGSFYYLAKSGVDIVALLESLHVSEKIINPLKDSSMGYIAVSYALYKLTTPIRYTVTLGGTTISINYLKQWGYIKPVPSPERLKEMVLERKDTFIETMREKKDGLKDTKEHIIEDLEKGIKKFSDKLNTKEAVKKHKKD